VTYVKRFKTMYLHTIDGEPASFDPQDDYIFFVGSRHKAMLVGTLRQIRREQKKALAAIKLARAFNGVHYGYVKVEVPLAADPERNE
jgi:hypothetical protein